jgi:hypothetical protein
LKKSKIPRLDDGQHESKASKPEPDERDEEVIEKKNKVNFYS